MGVDLCELNFSPKMLAEYLERLDKKLSPADMTAIAKLITPHYYGVYGSEVICSIVSRYTPSQ